MLDWLWDLLQQNAVASGGLLVLVTGAVMAQLRSLPSRAWRLLRERFILTVEIPDTDTAYSWVERWWAAQNVGRRTRTLILVTRPATKRTHDEDGELEVVLAPGEGEHFMLYRRTPIWMTMDREKVQVMSNRSYFYTMRLRVLGGRRQTVEQLIEEARAFCEDGSKGLTKVFMPMYESWTIACRKSVRALASLVFADGLEEELIEDLRKFEARREWYHDMGIPHRRGYLLHGPPGTGKSSLCLAAAAYLKMDVAILPLGSATLNDETLRKLFHHAPPNTVICLEDVDAIFEGRERKAENKVTFSGLLNVLDGIASADDRVVFMTTNRLECLDAALIRKGRCDRHFEVGYATREQARRYFLRFFPEAHGQAERFSHQLPPNTSMAELQEHLLRHQDDVDGACHLARLRVAV